MKMSYIMKEASFKKKTCDFCMFKLEQTRRKDGRLRKEQENSMCIMYCTPHVAAAFRFFYVHLQYCV